MTTMDRGLPDPETVQNTLALAVRAPSAHNSQPWRWRVGDATVQLYADPTGQTHMTDADQRDLVLSCGMALHHLRIALAAVGWSTVVRRLPNPADPNHLAAVGLVPHRQTGLDIALSAAISRRQTDRRRYSSRPVPAGHLGLLSERAAEFGAVVRRAHDGSRDDLMKAIHHMAHEHDAAELLVLGTSADDRTARLRAGEAASAVMLTATNVGLATSLLTEPLEIPGLRARVRVHVLDDRAHPQAVVRIGWAPTMAARLPTTPRRPIRDVLDPFDLATDR
jgi:nitroreductase